MKLQGMKIFTIIWFGQLVSLIGTSMTRFALLIWAYNQTNSAMTVALLGFFSFIPFIFISPVAGVWIDRLDRRLVLLLADLGAGLVSVTILLLFGTGNLAIWHLFVAGLLIGLFEAFQLPTYSAATTMLIPKEHYTRASGMRSIADYGSTIIGPVLAGALLGYIQLEGILFVDVVTFLIAVGSLLVVRIPNPEPDTNGSETGNTWQEVRVGWRFISQRPGLMGLLLIFLGMNFFAALTYFSILPALILARTGSDEVALAGVEAALGIGGVLGGFLLSIWGGPSRRIHGVLAGAALSFLLGDFLFAVGSSLQVWMVAAFTAAFFIPFIVGANRAIWQSKTPPNMQGRVFSVQSALSQAAVPVGYILGGLLADYVFEPAMAANETMAVIFGPLVGSGPGAGIGLMFLCTAVLGTLMSLSGYLVPAIRNLEIELPDVELVNLN